VGETIVHLSKVAFTPGGREVVVYVTFLGTIGLLIPFVTKDDLEFFQGLEMNMRQEHAPILGMSHMLYRGCYTPVKGAIDGDLCEQYLTLPLEKRRTIAEQLERTASEVMKKLEDIRSRSAF
jgi:splicing factor 3B subunit 3